MTSSDYSEQTLVIQLAAMLSDISDSQRCWPENLDYGRRHKKGVKNGSLAVKKK
jgi:hypothetical protein